MNQKIAIAIESFWGGGAELFAINLANALSRTKGYQVFFFEVYPERASSKKHIELIDESIEIIHVEKVSGWAVNFKSKFRKVIRLLKREGIGIVHSHSWDSDLFFAEVKEKYSNFKLINTMHGHYEFLKDRRFSFQQSTAKILRNMDFSVYLSNTHRQTLSYYDFPLNRIRRIFNGIPEMKVDPDFEVNDRVKLCLVSRAIPEKGWKIAIETVIDLCDNDGLNIELHIVGEGPILNELMEAYAHHAIIFHGFLKDVSLVLKESDIGILPSYYSAESQPTSIVEYLFCGLAVIASDIGAVKEMITYNDQLAGQILLLTNGKPERNDLKSAIKNYTGNNDLLSIHKKMALSAAKKFEMLFCVEEYHDLYYSITK